MARSLVIYGMIFLTSLILFSCQEQDVPSSSYNAAMLKAEEAMQSVEDDYKELTREERAWSEGPWDEKREEQMLAELYEAVQRRYKALRTAAVDSYAAEEQQFYDAIKEFKARAQDFLQIDRE